MSNEQALRTYQNALELHEDLYNAKLHDAMAEFRFNCRNDFEFFVEQLEEYYDNIELKNSRIISLLHEVCTNQVPGNQAAIVADLRAEFLVLTSKMAEQYYTDYPIEV